MKRVAASLTLLFGLLGAGVPAATTAFADSGQACVQGDININGTDTPINECVAIPDLPAAPTLPGLP